MLRKLKVLFVTNLPSPYRVEFFNYLSNECELTICYERLSASDRNKEWKGKSNKQYEEIYLNCRPILSESSFGWSVIHEICKKRYDRVILTNYASPSIAMAILICKLKKINYILEYDGGFNINGNEKKLKRVLKSLLINGAECHLTTCSEHKNYLLSLGVKEKLINIYPFTSLSEKDVLKTPVTVNYKKKIKSDLKIPDKKIVLTVGQFIRRKGFDLLFKAIKETKEEAEYYFIGGEPTEEYIQFIEQNQLKNIHFINFINKEELRRYYEAADLFVFPTREDIWGLVVNEAMAAGLPVISSDKCIAALEMIVNGLNGYIYKINDVYELANKIDVVLKNNELREHMSLEAIKTAKKYTFENMVKKHIEILKL